MNALRHLALVSVFFATTAALAVSGGGALFGDVINGESAEPVAGVVVTATSPSLQGVLTATTDAEGRYRIDGLPAGVYQLTFAKPGFTAEAIKNVQMRANATLRYDAVAYDEASGAATTGSAGAGDIVRVTAAAPVVDVGSTQAGATIDKELLRRVPIASPVSRGGPVRSFESAAVVAPQVQGDSFGASMNGATSVENQYVIEGLSVNNTAFGYNGTPLSIEFVEEINVITGGYMPEYGRSMGGLLDVKTKSGGNELHGSVFGNWSPGFLEGERLIPPNEGSAIRVQQELNYVADTGFEVGGPILRDRLWFFVGGEIARQSIFLNRELYSQAGQPLPGTKDQYEAESTSFQGLAKLTWLINDNNRLAFTVFGTPSTSGGNGKFGVDPETGRPESTRLEGEYSALAHIYRSGALDSVLQWELALLDRRLRFDTSLGWHHEVSGRLPSDGSTIGQGGLAALPRVEYRKSVPFPRSITDVENVPASAGCDATNEDGSPVCPITEYSGGGPDYINEALHDSIQLREVGTYLVDLFGLHIIKAGFNLGYSTYDNHRSYSGGRRYLEDEEATYWQDDRQFGFMVGPDDTALPLEFSWRTTSLFAGAFVQDSWTAFDLVTLNLGVRWDNEWLLASDGSVGLALPNQLSPRAGLILDPFQNGRMKLFGSYARYYQSVPLDIADRSSSSEPEVMALRPVDQCDPTTAAQTGCKDADKITLADVDQPDQKWFSYGAGRTTVDPALQPASSDEIVAGAEAEIFRDARIGVSYTKRWLNVAIEDMSRDEANTYFIGNPGFGIAKDFEKATRDYDGLTFHFYKQWSEGWIAQASYTLSYLRGNYAGLFRPETEQLNPNINSDFDLKSLTVNRTGPLPFDRNHQFKLYGARQFETAQDTLFTIGFSGGAMSGAPISYLASHQIYGEDEVFVIPRGAGDRTEWIFTGDVHGGFTFEIIKGQPVELTIDIFNLLNLQGAVDVDETWSDADVTPLLNCNKASDDPSSCTVADLGKAKGPEGEQIADSSISKNHGKPEAYQLPRTVRFGMRWSF